MRDHQRAHVDTNGGSECPGPVSPLDRRALNLPNVLCVVRLIGSIAMVVLAGLGEGRWFLVLLVLLWVTDWGDGKIARWWRQQTPIGARLDSIADGAMYFALLIGAWWLRPEAIASEWWWLTFAVASYLISLVASVVRFGRMPSYHTRSAKTCWLLAGLAALALFAAGPLWPIRVAAVVVVLANLEAMAITLVLPHPRDDVPSIYHAWRDRHKRSAQSTSIADESESPHDGP